jgi:uncharacterized protein
VFRSRVFSAWLAFGYAVWAGLFAVFNSLSFLAAHWYYPAIMVLGAFVAGLTPEGGGAVAFPMLSVFMSVDRAMARDFSLMIQSIGMTSATIFILTDKANDLRAYRPLLAFVPVGFIGFVAGMALLQSLPVYIIQALFLSLITTFGVAYKMHSQRGFKAALDRLDGLDLALLGLVLILGGMCASLFGTGAGMLIFTLLVTRMRMQEKIATHFAIMLMAALSIAGYAYRGFADHGLTAFQVRTWLCAYPIVLFMAPFGAYALQKLNVEVMLRAVVALNLLQIAYFNFHNPSIEKTIATLVFCAVLMTIFSLTLARMARNRALQGPALTPEAR